MNPRKKILVVLLSLGTVLGFGAGIASVARKSCARRAAFEQRVADTCVAAAARYDRDQRARSAEVPPP
jgi:hypothetical protein